MNFLDRIAHRLGYVKRGNQYPAWLRQTAFAERFTVPDGSLLANQAELYQRLTWVQIAVGHVARAAAISRFDVKQRVGERLKNIENHPFELLLQRPNPFYSRYRFLVAIFSYYLLTGNAYIFLNRSSEKDEPCEMWPVPPQKMQPVPDDTGTEYLRGYLYYPDGLTVPAAGIPLENWEILHIKNFHPLNSWVGLSPIEALAMDATSDMKMQEWQANFFGKDYAKPAGAFAFADSIRDPDWNRMKKDIKGEHGGTSRNMLMLRNVGKGGIQWLSMAISQKDMDFLASREFTKEEIFALFAPGLSSMLAINSTEANSVTGKATFNELAVWPHMVDLAEEITNSVLPVYSVNLIGEFEDIRITDRAMELQEQTAAERVMVVDEVREKFYQLDSIGDERGSKLISEIGGGSIFASQVKPESNGKTELEEPKEAEKDNTKGLSLHKIGVDNESNRPLSITKAYSSAIVALFVPEVMYRDFSILLDAIPDYIAKTPLNELHLTLLYLGEATEIADKQEMIQAIINDFTLDAPSIFGSLNGLGRFNKTNDDGTQAIYASFDSPALPEFRQLLARRLMEAGIEIGSEHGFTPHITLGYLPAGAPTPNLGISPIKISFEHITVAWAGQRTEYRLHGAPDGSRSYFDQRLLTSTKSGLRDSEQRLYDAIAPIFRGAGQSIADLIQALEEGEELDWDGFDEELRRALLVALEEAALERANELAVVGVGFDPVIAATTASDWAASHSFELVSNLNENTRSVLQTAVNRYHSYPMTREELALLLRPAFGLVRAEMIAITEITRASAEGARIYQEQLSAVGIEMIRINRTNNDALVCPKCAPLNGLPESQWRGLGPPWHPRCQCFVTLRAKQNV